MGTKYSESQARDLERVFASIVAKVKLDPAYNFYQEIWYNEKIIGNFRLK